MLIDTSHVNKENLVPQKLHTDMPVASMTKASLSSRTAHTVPNFLPMISARPSPPHIREMAMRPAGLSLQHSSATEINTIQ
jgi:hypothetical protein